MNIKFEITFVKDMAIIVLAMFPLLSSAQSSGGHVVRPDNNQVSKKQQQRNQSVAIVVVDGMKYQIKGDQARLIEGKNASTVIIPQFINHHGKNLPVIAIDQHAFNYCEDVTSITIPNSVTSIGYRALQNCNGLTSIVLPNSITTISRQAFIRCKHLKSITIPKSVMRIEEDLFGGCEELKSIIVDSGNKKYDSRNECNAIIETATNELISGCKYTIIPNSVNIIGFHAFCDFKTSFSIVIPEGVRIIDNSAFSLSEGLRSITIPNSITSIGEGAFMFCSGLTSVTIPSSVKSIGKDAFNLYLKGNKHCTIKIPKTTKLYSSNGQQQVFSDNIQVIKY